MKKALSSVSQYNPSTCPIVVNSARGVTMCCNSQKPRSPEAGKNETRPAWKSLSGAAAARWGRGGKRARTHTHSGHNKSPLAAENSAYVRFAQLPCHPRLFLFPARTRHDFIGRLIESSAGKHREQIKPPTGAAYFVAEASSRDRYTAPFNLFHKIHE